MEHPPSPLTHELLARIRALKDRHVPDLPWRQAQVLTLQAMGFSDGEIASQLEITPTTVQGLAYSARRAVVPDGYISDHKQWRPLRAAHRSSIAWAWIHRNCCTATAFSAMQLEESAASGRLSELSGRPFPELAGELALVASLTACGLADDEIANAIAVSTATVRRRHRAIIDAFAVGGVAVDLNEACTAAWLHGECCGALPAEVLDIVRSTALAAGHGTTRPAQQVSIAAFLRRARLVPLIAAMWIGASMSAAIGKKRRVQVQEEAAITAFAHDAPPHVAPKDP